MFPFALIRENTYLLEQNGTRVAEEDCIMSRVAEDACIVSVSEVHNRRPSMSLISIVFVRNNYNNNCLEWPCLI